MTGRQIRGDVDLQTGFTGRPVIREVPTPTVEGRQSPTRFNVRQ